MSSPIVSVLLCHHLEVNRPYLDACIRSLQAQKGIDFEVILITGRYFPGGIPSDIRRHHVDASLCWSQKINEGMRVADPLSKYFLLLNDDTVLSEDAIASMVRALGDNEMILNPKSNCDNGRLYWTDITFTEPGKPPVSLAKQFYTIDELGHAEGGIIAYKPGPTTLLQVPYVCFYATMIPRAVVKRVGQLDENLRTSHDDEDYCLRARKIGIPSMVDLGSFILHFGGRTSSVNDTDAQRDATLKHFQSKWAVRQ